MPFLFIYIVEPRKTSPIWEAWHKGEQIMGITLNQLKAQFNNTQAAVETTVTQEQPSVLGGLFGKARKAAKAASTSVAGSLPVTTRRFEKAQEDNHKRDVVNNLIVMDMIEQLAEYGINIEIDSEENLEARAEAFMNMLKQRQAEEAQEQEEVVVKPQFKKKSLRKLVVEDTPLIQSDEELEEYMTGEESEEEVVEIEEQEEVVIEEEEEVQEESQAKKRRRLGKIGRQAPISDDVESAE